MNENGENYDVYKMKCLGFFKTMLKSKTGAFDNNYLLSQNKTILINNFFYTVLVDVSNELRLCIEFDDPITKGKGYACLDSNYNDLVFALNGLNSNIKGYFFISNVGFNNAFFFPLSTSSGRIPTEYIFRWDFDFVLDEKVNFYYYIKKFFT